MSENTSATAIEVMEANVQMKVFSNEKCELGESPLWHPQRGSLLWLDILQRKLYEKKLGATRHESDRVWNLPEYTSVLSLDKYNPDLLWMVTDKSFGNFDLCSGSFEKLLDLNLNKAYRTNDGGVSPNGDFWFGTMAWEPRGINGDIYSVTASAKLIKHQLKLGIPNTFCWTADNSGLLITDSFQQRIFHYQVSRGNLKQDSKFVFKDLSKSTSTPDGGALDIHGRLWIARWGGSKVVKYDQNGVNKGEIILPVPRPTSCCFGGPNNCLLFITTARTGLSKSDLADQPLSGSVFVVKANTPGLPLMPFCLES
ncbi:MAG: SMP-30/gluconolactonase/LRE family protein [Xanthomonadales bacterium]|nr:SMP-30/gluconolactonase/LRE family protein [Xanthomonadales bacterium]